MIIQAIKTSGSQKLVAIASRYKSGKTTQSFMCDWNCEPGCLRIFWNNSDVQSIPFATFRDVVKYIFGLK